MIVQEESDIFHSCFQIQSEKPAMIFLKHRHLLLISLFFHSMYFCFECKADIGWSSIGNTVGGIRNVAISSHPGILYAVADTGVFKSVNEGLTWESITSELPETNRFNFIMCSRTSPDVLYVSTSQGRIYVSEDEGFNWITLDAGNNFYRGCVNPGNPYEGYLGCQGSIIKVYKSGESWHSSSLPGLERAFITDLAMHPDYSQYLYVATEQSGVYRMNLSDGSFLQSLPGDRLDNRIPALAIDTVYNKVYCCSFIGNVFQSDLNLSSWTQLPAIPDARSRPATALCVSGDYSGSKSICNFSGDSSKLDQNEKPGESMYPVTILSSSQTKQEHKYLTEFSLVNAGTFTMGSPSGEPCRDWDENQFTVTLSQSFLVSTTEITQEQWTSKFSLNPSSSPGAQKPVDNITWFDACIFCNLVSLDYGLEPCYYADSGFTVVFNGTPPVSTGQVFWKQAANGFRLLTEAEWEYTCRAGTTSAYSNGLPNLSCSGEDQNLNDIAWYNFNSASTIHPIGLKTPNGNGCYDMHGNVSEWCWDWMGIYPTGSVTDPTGPESGVDRIIRGGCYQLDSRFARSAEHTSRQPGNPGYVGLRIARWDGPLPYTPTPGPPTETPTETPSSTYTPTATNTPVPGLTELFVAQDGRILHFSNNQWVNINCPLSSGTWVYSLEVSKHSGYLISGGSLGCHVFCSDISTWQIRNRGLSNLDIRHICPDYSDENAISMACAFQGVFSCLDGGSTWIASDGLSTLTMYELERDPLDPSILYAGTHYGFARSFDHGFTWEMVGQLSGQPLEALVYTIEAVPINGQTVILIGSQEMNQYHQVFDGVLRSTDYGMTWTHASGISNRPEYIKYNPLNPYEILTDQNISNDGGLSFSPGGHGGTDLIFHPQNPNIVYLMGGLGGESFYTCRSSDNGNTFDCKDELFLSDLIPDFHAFNRPDSLDQTRSPHYEYRLALDHDYENTIYFTFDWMDTVLVSQNGGESWQPSPGFEPGRGMSDVDGDTAFNRVFAGHKTGKIYRTVNQGNTWELDSRYFLQIPDQINDIIVNPDSVDEVYIATDGYGVWKSSDASYHWKPKNNGLASDHHCISAMAIDRRNPERILIIATDDSYSEDYLYETINGGDDWILINGSMNLGAPVTDVCVVDTLPLSSEVWIATEGSGVFYSPDSGMTWTAQPLNPEPDELNFTSVSIAPYLNSEDLPYIFATCYGGAGAYIWDYQSSQFTGINSGLPQQSGESYIDFIFLDPEFGKIWVGSTDGLFQSSDFGSNWSEAFIPFTKSKDVSHSSGLICSDNEYFYFKRSIGIFHSDDGGLSWNPFDYGLLPFDRDRLNSIGVVGDGEPKMLIMGCIRTSETCRVDDRQQLIIPLGGSFQTPTPSVPVPATSTCGFLVLFLIFNVLIFISFYRTKK